MNDVATAAETVDHIVRASPALIDRDQAGRIGLFYPAKAAGLACLIAADGQREPIQIAKSAPRAKLPFVLVAGLHRLDACEQLGRDVEARIVSGSADELLRMQASENIDRRVMTVLERSMFVAAVAEAAKWRLRRENDGLSQQKVAIERRWAIRLDKLSSRMEPSFPADVVKAADREAADAVARLALVYSWKQETAAACDMGEKDVQRSLRIYRNLVAPHRSLISTIQDHFIADNQDALVRLAGMGAPLQAAVLGWFAANPDAKALDEALVALGEARSKGDRDADKQEGQTKFLTRAESNLDRLTPSIWRSWAPVLATKVKRSALLAVRDAINARIDAEGGVEALERGQ